MIRDVFTVYYVKDTKCRKDMAEHFAGIAANEDQIQKLKDKILQKVGVKVWNVYKPFELIL
jgi:hypothetical protein